MLLLPSRNWNSIPKTGVPGQLAPAMGSPLDSPNSVRSLLPANKPILCQGDRQRARPSAYGSPCAFVVEQIISVPASVRPVAPGGEQKAPGWTKLS